MYETVGGISGAALGYIAGGVPGAKAGFQYGRKAGRIKQGSARYESERTVIFFTNYEDTKYWKKISISFPWTF